MAQEDIGSKGLSRKQTEDFLKGKGRAINDFTGVTTRDDGSFDVNGVPSTAPIFGAAPTGGSDGPPVDNAVGAGNTSPLVATSNSILDDLGNALSKFGETDKQRQERISLTRAEFGEEAERITQTGEDLKAVRRARASKGGQAGVGIETLTDNEIRLIKKDTEKALESNTVALRKAIAAGNTAAEDKARENLKLAFSMQLDIDNQEIKKRQLELDEMSTTSQIDLANKSFEFQIKQEDRDINAEERAVVQREKEATQALMTEFSAAGITEEDSYAEALRKASPYLEETRKLELEKLQAEIARQWDLAQGGGGGGDGLTPTVGFTDSDTEKSVREDVTEVAAAINSGEMDNATAFNTIRGLYSQAEATDEAIQAVLNQSLGITPAGTEEIEGGGVPGEVGGSTTSGDPTEDFFNNPIGGIFNLLVGNSLTGASEAIKKSFK